MDTLRLHVAITEAIIDLMKVDADGALMAVAAAFVGLTTLDVARNGCDEDGEIITAFDGRKITIHAKEQTNEN